MSETFWAVIGGACLSAVLACCLCEAIFQILRKRKVAEPKCWCGAKHPLDEEPPDSERFQLAEIPAAPPEPPMVTLLVRFSTRKKLKAASREMKEGVILTNSHGRFRVHDFEAEESGGGYILRIHAREIIE